MDKLHDFIVYLPSKRELERLVLEKLIIGEGKEDKMAGNGDQEGTI